MSVVTTQIISQVDHGESEAVFDQFQVDERSNQDRD